MRLVDLGWDEHFALLFAAHAPQGASPVRIAEENRGGLYRTHGAAGDRRARALSHTYRSGADRLAPVVGDWVAVSGSGTPEPATILDVLPRRNALLRQAAGKRRLPQCLAANVDYVFVVSSLNRELNPRRLERALTIAWDSGAQPVVLLSKADLADEDPLPAIQHLAGTAPVHRLSVVTGEGLATILELLAPGRTAVVIGSSGVGKSSLINALRGTPVQRVGAIRTLDDRGRHTTTSRQLVVLPSGGNVIDTPGLRELQLWLNEEGLAATFGDIATLASQCRFGDCTHQSEPGCAVLEALERGELAPERLGSQRKLEAELRYAARRDDSWLQRSDKQRAKRLCRDLKRSQRHDGRG